MDDELLVFNGLDGDTGKYLTEPRPVADIAAVVRGDKPPDPEHLAELKARAEEGEAHYALVEGLDPKDLAQAGWGVIFAFGADPAIRAALQPLLDLRRSQATQKDERLYREFVDDAAYRPGESKTDFVGRHGAGAGGPVDPRKIPYYLMIVGDPETIPFRFQYQLDVQYAVGRLAFPAVEDYARYAQSVVAAERGEVARPRQASFFAVQNPDDRSTELSANEVVKPLSAWTAGDQPLWSVKTVLPADAKRARLEEILGGGETPAFLFSGSHGMGFRNGHARQFAHTGGIVCQDWPGPQWDGGNPRDFYVAAEDIASDAQVAGLIAMFFACFGAGCPKMNDFAAMDKLAERNQIAPQSFVSALPQRLLAHPKGGALAVIGHVDRAWGTSFRWKKSGQQLQTFQSTLKRLLEGHPVGSAMEYFNNRYAELSSDLNVELEELKWAKKPDDSFLAGMWTASNDARNYCVIGDPAVRLALAELPRRPEREVIAVAAAAPVAAAAAGEGDPAQFGLFDPLREAGAGLGGTIQTMAERMAQALERTLTNLTTLEVSTYVTSELGAARVENGRVAGAQLRAHTRLSLDGDTHVCVPEDAGQLNQALWKVHCDSVAQASAHRAEMLKLAASAVSSLLGVLKK
jgi:hypothetical protein